MRQKRTPPPVAEKPQMPDKVVNMAAKSGSDKKPFSYAPDVGSLTEQRDKVRRKYVIVSVVVIDVKCQNVIVFVVESDVRCKKVIVSVVVSDVRCKNVITSVVVSDVTR